MRPVGHPARGKHACTQVLGELVHALQEKGGIAPSAGVDHAPPNEQGHCRQERQEKRQEEIRVSLSGDPLAFAGIACQSHHSSAVETTTALSETAVQGEESARPTQPAGH